MERRDRQNKRAIAEMNVLQGLPTDFLKRAPFTDNGKRSAIGNGVPLPMGTAIARAVRECLSHHEKEHDHA
jgi:site-specific DNA-cytosine methylase